MARQKKKVLMANCGLDGHDAGTRIIVKALVNAGAEVVYLGILRTPEEVVHAAIEEDVDVIGIGTFSGIHCEVAEEVIKLLNENNCSIPVIMGGIIPKQDIDLLKKTGICEAFIPGVPLENIITFINNLGGDKDAH